MSENDQNLGWPAGRSPISDYYSAYVRNKISDTHLLTHTYVYTCTPKHRLINKHLHKHLHAILNYMHYFVV